MIQLIKDFLVRLGPKNALVRGALRFHGSRCGFEITYPGDCIVLRKREREMVLGKAQFIEVPLMMDCFELYFNTVESESAGDCAVLNFSRPGLHRYIGSQGE